MIPRKGWPEREDLNFKLLFRDCKMLIVEAEWLLSKYSCSGWHDSIVILDGSWYLPNQKRDPLKEHMECRIPNALFFDIDSVCDNNSNLPHTIPNVNQFEKSMNELGLKNTNHIVIYSKDGIATSPRVWWLLKIFGHQKISILNGGLKAWIDIKGQTEKGQYENIPASNFKANYNNNFFCTTEEVKASMNSNNSQIIDARSQGRFNGTEPEPRKNLQSGHIPGSKNLPYQSLLDEKGRLLEINQISEILSKAGIDTDNPIISTCGSGVSACVLALALEILGKNNWKIYDGSWTEWGRRRDTPIET